MAWLYFIDAVTVTMVTPSTSQSWIGKTVKLTCTADGAPTPALSWENPRGVVIKREIDFKTTVNVSMSSDEDFGNYTCEATNDVNTDTRTVLVQQISKWNICCSLVVHKYLWYTYKREKKHSVILPFRQFFHILFFYLRKHIQPSYNSD